MMLTKKERKTLLSHPDILVKKLFLNDDGEPLELTPYQTTFLKDIIQKKYPKSIFCAATRSGKSEIISISIILLGILYSNEEILCISYTWSQSQIIFNKAKQHLFDSDIVLKQVDRTKEFTQATFIFYNGSSIKCMSAGGSSKGEGILGFGASILVIDESGSIEDEIYYQKIMRMIATGRKERMVIESGTPHRKNHFFETYNNPNYKNYKVTWEEAVKAGQLSKQEVMEIKERLTDIEFKMWYEAEFPKEAEDSLFKYQDIVEAQEREVEVKDGIKILGVDVARFGVDLTVFTIVLRNDDVIKVTDIEYSKKANLMNTVGKIIDLDREHNFDKINIDVIGVGSGVVDRLLENPKMSGKVVSAHFGQSPVSEESRKRYLNKKSEQYFKLRSLFEAGTITIPKHKRLIDELLDMRFQFTSVGKLTIVDPSKSPDFADSLVYAIWGGEVEVIIDF